MMDYSPFFPEMMQSAVTMPMMDTLQRELPGAVQAGSTALAQAEAKKNQKISAEQLGDHAKTIGLDPGMVQTLYRVDPIKALDYVIQGTEKYNQQQADTFVGSQLEGISVPQEGYTNDKGLPITDPTEIQNRLRGQRRSGIISGIETAKTPYVKKAYEDRLTKIDASTTDWKRGIAEQRANHLKGTWTTKQIEQAYKAAGYAAPPVIEAARAEHMAQSMKDIQKTIQTLENTTGPDGKAGDTVGLYTMGAAQGVMNNLGTVSGLIDAVLAKYDATVRKQVMDAAATTNSYKEAAKKLAASNKGQAVLAINDALGAELMMKVFEKIHEFTGTAMGAEERASYYKAFSMNGRRGAAGVMEWYNRDLDRQNYIRKRQLEGLLHTLDTNFIMDPHNEGYLGERARIEAALATPLPPIDPAFIKQVAARNVGLPGETPSATPADRLAADNVFNPPAGTPPPDPTGGSMAPIMPVVKPAADPATPAKSKIFNLPTNTSKGN